jgi:predicted alpha/beta superfamily hydrolase
LVGFFTEGTGKMRRQPHRIAVALEIACVCLIVAGLAACAGDGKHQEVTDDTIGSVTLATVDSARTGAVYKLSIYLPASYATGTASYPVIYATDGDAAFPPEGRFVNFAKILQRRHVESILVGIGGTERRKKDFLLPGAKAYHAFLTQELIPFIESHFRADPKRRILSGLSYGGLFVVTALFLEAPDTLYFSDYISAEGSVSLPAFVALERTVSSTIGTRSIPATLILARGSVGNKGSPQPFSAAGGKGNFAIASFANDLGEFTNSDDVHSLYRRLLSRHYVDLIVIETNFATDHVGTDNPSFEDAVVRIFK